MGMLMFLPFPSCHSPLHRRTCHKSQTRAGSGSPPEPSRETCPPTTCVLCGSRTWMPQNHRSEVMTTKLMLQLQLNQNVCFGHSHHLQKTLYVCMEFLKCTNQTINADYFSTEKEDASGGDAGISKYYKCEYLLYCCHIIQKSIAIFLNAVSQVIRKTVLLYHFKKMWLYDTSDTNRRGFTICSQ